MPALPDKSPTAGFDGPAVIFTADDFGRSHAVNTAVFQAHREGALTGASLMVTGAAADEAVALARETPGLAVGLHLVTVAGLLFSLVMLRGGVFGRVASWSGILANALMLVFVGMLMVALPLPSALYAIPPSVSTLFRMLWYVLTAVALLRRKD